MKKTRSGEYKLPGQLKLWVGNLLLASASLVPGVIRNRFLRRHNYYQVFSEVELGGKQGLSINKWKAMQMPTNLYGKSVIDIGCADGFFSLKCAQKGANPVLGVDSSIGRLLWARFKALEEGVNVEYRMDIFPSCTLREKFDYVLCLSVLHHFFSTKDFWKVLICEDYTDALVTLRENLKHLRALTADQGQCIIEMPYEYDDTSDRKTVNFEHFNSELVNAGFSSARCLGSWKHNEKYRKMKDRFVYVAEA